MSNWRSFTNLLDSDIPRVDTRQIKTKRYANLLFVNVMAEVLDMKGLTSLEKEITFLVKVNVNLEYL